MGHVAMGRRAGQPHPYSVDLGDTQARCWCKRAADSPLHVEPADCPVCRCHALHERPGCLCVVPSCGCWDPTAMVAGARIGWLHYEADGTGRDRRGVLWRQAPPVTGAVIVWWVVPDQPAPGDLCRLIAVGKAVQYQPVFGTGRGVQSPRDPWVVRGRLFSSDRRGAPLANLMVHAELRAEQRRSDRRHYAEATR